ncbi:hypothetical protein SAC12B_0115 [Lactobacillus phage SAC12B]|uniref:Uncharacterized protein n=1 Tax=Lactobacillus phage SAC12B TaxID=2510941 RepID=A0A4Y5FIH0_9CAUD|nr:hypothetical protein HWC10_gp186 [Lactobacillus phage SAC12B]QBJ03904.1 hypothetical protein SAC12B_0115 [Lactobacillus phage SAC12B]
MNDWLAGAITGILLFNLLPILFGDAEYWGLSNHTIAGKVFMTLFVLFIIVIVFISNKLR